VLVPPVYDALVGPMMRNLGLSRRAVPPSSGNVFRAQARVEGGPARWSRGRLGAAGVAVTAAAVLLARHRWRA
jgi:hypothetical protein